MRLQVYLSIWATFLISSALANANPSSAPWTSTRTNLDQIVGDSSLHSTQGRPFPIYQFRRPSSQAKQTHPHRFLIQAGLHGNEKMTSVFVMWLTKRLNQNQGALSHLPEGTEIDFLPFANPDAYGSSRYNKNNINLNRNFSVLWGLSREPSGSEPESEAETRAITKLMQTRLYHGAVDVHGYVKWIVAPTIPDSIQFANTKQTQKYWRWLSILDAHIKQLPDYRLNTAGDLGDGGAFEDWGFWRNDTLSFCLEMSQTTKSPQNTDSEFLRYEHFIASVFAASLKIDSVDQALALESKQRHHREMNLTAGPQFNHFSKSTNHHEHNHLPSDPASSNPSF